VQRGWTPVIISGGFRQAIQPLAEVLGVGRIEAVDLFFEDDGRYRGFDAKFPTTRSGGKAEVIQRLKQELQPARVIMVGDGVSDLEVASTVDLFVGFGRYLVRERVRREAAKFITLARRPAAVAARNLKADRGPDGAIAAAGRISVFCSGGL